MIFYFLKDDILFLHAEIIREYGGSDGIRDEGLLESAISAPLQTFASNDLYPTIVEKIARLSFGLAMDHPFIDGNKRIAAKALDVGLSANNIDLRATNEELASEFLLLASGKIPYPDFLSWVYSKI